MFIQILNLLLLFVIFCSKEIIVFNEEILILFAFTLFIYLVFTKTGSQIVEQLDISIVTIKNLYITGITLKEQIILEQIDYFQRLKFLRTKIVNLMKLKNLYINKLLISHNRHVKKSIFNYLESILYRFALHERTKNLNFINNYFVFVEEFYLIIVAKIMFDNSSKNDVDFEKIKLHIITLITAIGSRIK